MAKIISPYEFDGEAPTADQIHKVAESLGGLSIGKQRIYGRTEFEFECLAGKVELRRSAGQIFLMSDTGEAPVLHDLLRTAAEKLGGEVSSGGKPTEIQLPLTKESVESSTLEFRRKVSSLALPAWLTLAGIALASLVAMVALIWLGSKFIFPS